MLKIFWIILQQFFFFKKKRILKNFVKEHHYAENFDKVSI